MWQSRNPEYFVEILNVERKADLVKLCRSITLHGDDLANLVLSSKVGTLPFLHDSHHREFIPNDVQLRPKDLKTLAGAEVGKMTASVHKAFGRVDQIFRTRRLLNGHLFYLPDRTRWALFYFDQRDMSAGDNHWQHGSHLHLVTHLWPGWTVETIWRQFHSGDPQISGALHVRFRYHEPRAP
jgi:hypothetical protein